MNLFLALLAVLIWAVMAGISLFAKVKVFGQYADNSIVKILVGPLVIMIAGVWSMLVGVIGTSPITLFLAGYGTWSLVALIILIFLSFFAKVKINGDNLHWALRMPIGLVCFLIGGALMFILGAFMASPIILLVIAAL